MKPLLMIYIHNERKKERKLFKRYLSFFSEINEGIKNQKKKKKKKKNDEEKKEKEKNIQGKGQGDVDEWHQQTNKNKRNI